MEEILVCLSGAPSNVRVIKAAAKMAEAYGGNLTALYVEPPDLQEHEPEARARLEANFRLAHRLGAKVTRLYGEDAATQIAEYARVSGSTKIVIGKSPTHTSVFRKKTLIDRLNELAPDIDIFIIPDKATPSERAHRLSFSDERFSVADVLKTLGLLTAATLGGLVFTKLGFSTANVIILYTLAVLGIAVTTTGRSYSLASAVLSVFVFNFLFTVPLHSFSAEPSEIATFVVMFIAAIIISSLTTQIKRQARLKAQHSYRTEILLETSQRMQKAESEEQILSLAATQLGKLSGRGVMIFPVKDGTLGEPMLFPSVEGDDFSPYLESSELAAAREALATGHGTGCGTQSFPNAKGLYMAIRSTEGVLAVVCFSVNGQPERESYSRSLTVAILDECGIMLENERYKLAKREMEEKARAQELRANLLRSISHDLRTPLTGISGSASLLLTGKMSEDQRTELLKAIRDDSEWLITLVENLLCITRIEGRDKLTELEPELVGEVIADALTHIDRSSAQHKVTTVIADDYLMANMDARLIEQVLINLVNNAVKYTPAGSTICVSAESSGGSVLVSVSDNGPGIADASKGKIFDMFYTEAKTGDSRRGLGLGLALCKSIVTAHGGEISVSDAKPHGAVFTFSLPEVKTDEQGTDTGR